MKIIRLDIRTKKEATLAECDTDASAKELQKVYIKEMYDRNEQDNFVIFIK